MSNRNRNRGPAKPATDVTTTELAAMTGDATAAASAAAAVISGDDNNAGDPLTNLPVVVLEGDQPAPVVADAPVLEAEAPVVTADAFADLPTIKVDEFEFRDLSSVAPGANVFKYAGVANAALEAKAQTKVGWKYGSAMLTLGTHRPDLKPGTVYGDIQAIVGSYGRAGVPAYVVVARLRQKQIGNKRSKYCTELAPIGWAEGWIDTFISKNYGKVMDKKAPSLTPEAAADLNTTLAGDAAESEQRAAA